MDNQLVAHYLQTEQSGVGSEMANETPRNRKQVQISLSENQLTALDKAAAEMGLNRSEFVRWLLAQQIANFPQDLMEHGAGLNKPREL